MISKAATHGGVLLGIFTAMAMLAAVSSASAQTRRSTGQSARSWDEERPARFVRSNDEPATADADASESLKYQAQWRTHPKVRDRFVTQASRTEPIRSAQRQFESLPEPRLARPRLADPEEVPPGAGFPEEEYQFEYETDSFGEVENPVWRDSCGGCTYAFCRDCRSAWRNFPLLGSCWDLGCPWTWTDELSVFGGAQSFKGGLDLGANGNFGFHEGINWGGPLWHHHGVGYQIGAQAVQSDLNGDQVDGARDANRNQVFVTAGLFFRAACNHGWQFGVVFDWLEDDFYIDIAVSQLRSELSYVTSCGHEVGAWTANGSNPDAVDGLEYEAVDQFAFFYRRNLKSGAQGRAWGGVSGEGDGLVGADFRVPFSRRWELTGGVNYLIPQESGGQAGSEEESWGMALNLVWHPFRDRNGRAGHTGLYRPLFNVADNNMLMIQRNVLD